MNTTTPSTKDQLIGKLCETSTGSIRLVDVMGDDHRVVQAARISFGKQAQVINADKDRALLRYLMRNRHTSPFEQCELTFIVECPMDLWRQWVRHRTANVNEYSTRYAPAFNNAAMAATRPDSWRLQATNNKQGSDGLLDPIIGGRFSIVEQRFQSIARDVYKERIEAGVAKEHRDRRPQVHEPPGGGERIPSGRCGPLLSLGPRDGRQQLYERRSTEVDPW